MNVLVTWRRIQGYEESSSSVLFVAVSQGKFPKQVLSHAIFWRLFPAQVGHMATHLLEDFNLLAQKMVLQEVTKMGIAFASG